MTVDAIVRDFAQALRPPADMLVSAWADQFRMLSPEASAERGEWRTDRAPYQKAIMDALSPHSPYERVVVMSSSQIGKTEVLNNFIGYVIDQEPGPILVVQPRGDDAKAWSKDRLAPMLRDTPCLQGKVSEVKSRDSANTVLHKSFTGGHLTVAGSISPAGLASRPIRFALFDEVDRYPASAGLEGDPVQLGIKRTATFWNRKIGLFSTPTVRGASRIEVAFESSSKQRFHVPCPECGAFQRLEWERVVWFERPEDAEYRCSGCEQLIPHFRKPWMLSEGRWVAENPSSNVAGFHINELYSPWRTWGQTAVDFLEAEQSPELLRVWINTSLGELWSDEEQQGVGASDLSARREPYGPEIPAGVVVLTVGVDVQADRLEAELVGWGPGEESWSIEFVVFPGDPTAHTVWAELDEWLLARRPNARGEGIPVGASAIDSGYGTQHVYDFARRRFGRRVFAVKGRAGQLPVWPRRPSRKAGALLYTVGVDAAKEVLAGRLRIQEPGPGYCHFPTGRNDEFFHQLTSEVLTTTYSRGVPVRLWRRRPGARAEALDCRVYAYAALCGLSAMGLDLRKRETPRVASEALPAPAIAAAASTRRVQRSRWLNGA
jgi:phage terminase large subunit GpA-like protein